MNIPTFTSIPAHLPVDWILIAAFVVIIALDAYRAGSARAAALAFAAPLSLVLINALPQTFILGPLSVQFSAPAAQALLFGVVFVVLFLLIHRVVASFSGGGLLLQSFIAGMAGTAVLLVVWLQVPAFVSLWHFGPQIQTIFGEAYRFWWLIGAYFVLAFVRS